MSLLLSLWLAATLLVDGNPPLTDVMVKDMRDYFAWTLRSPLTQAQEDQVQTVLLQIWKKNQQAGVEQLFDQISNMAIAPSGTLNELRPGYRDQLLDWEPPLGDLARSVDADVRKVVVAGDPPLTRQAVEAFSEWYVFALGHAGPPPGDVFNDSMASSLQAIYPSLTAENRQALANAPASWAALRKQWPGLSTADQAALRAKWQQTLAPLLARRQPLRPAFQALEALRTAANSGDPQATEQAVQAVSQQAASLRKLGTPDANALASRLDELASKADALAQINNMSAEIADRTHLPLSDPDSLQPVFQGSFYPNWATQGMGGFQYRW